MRILKTISLLAAVIAASVLMPITASQADATLTQRSLSAGANSTCALRASNAIYCAGDDTFGELGDGETTDSSEPVQVLGISAALSVSEGKTFGCVIDYEHYGACWGDNSLGQLGSEGTSSYVRRISLGQQLVDIQAGDSFACAISVLAKLYCWGNLGAGLPTQYNASTPTLVSEASNVTAVAISSAGFCVLSSSVSCVGKAPFTSSLTAVSGTAGATAIAIGSDFGCALISGLAKCWGDNTQGQLGQGNFTAVSGLVTVTGISDAVKITSGNQFACVLNSAGASFCWGDNTSKQISISGQDQSTRVPTVFSSVADIDAGSNYLCALLLDGSIKCIGDNSKGQSGVIASSTSPIGPLAGTNYYRISTGTDTTCAVDISGNLHCWGANIPTSTAGNFADVAVGNVSACAVTTKGPVLCWGANGSGQLGDGTNKSSTVPVAVQGLGTGKVSHISAGYRHFCATTTDGLVYCWGDDSHQQLGYQGADSKTAVPVAGIGIATNVTSGANHSCAIQSDGSVYCWGDNAKKQINSTSTTRLGVTSVASSGISKVQAGGNQTCILGTDKQLNCFGDNSELQSPGLMSGTYSDVAVGLNSVCATKTTTFQVTCFGSNTNTKLGRTGAKSATPSDVGSLTASTISVGDESACSISQLSKIKCWGSNSNGQLASSFGFPAAFATVTASISGSANIGETLTATLTHQEDYASATVTWYKSSDIKANGLALSGANTNTYSPVVADLNRYFNVGIVLTKWGISSSMTRSANVGPVGPATRILQSSTPTVSGKFKVGSLLFARSGTWDKRVTFTYQWYRGTFKIPKATSSIYKLTAVDAGKQMSVWVTGSKIGMQSILTKSAKTSKILR